jgi:hypothetical protein
MAESRRSEHHGRVQALKVSHFPGAAFVKPDAQSGLLWVDCVEKVLDGEYANYLKAPAFDAFGRGRTNFNLGGIVRQSF